MPGRCERATEWPRSSCRVDRCPVDVSTDNSVASFYELLLPLLIDHGNPSATSFTQVLDISQESRQLRNVAGDAPRPVHSQHLGYVSIGSCLSAMLLAEDADPFLPRVRGLTRSAQGPARPV